MNKFSITQAPGVVSALLIDHVNHFHRVDVYYLCQPKTQGHARILNTGPARSMATTTKPYKLFHVPTHRVGVYLCQPGTQRHARFWNTGGVTTTNKYFQADQWRWVPFLVGVYLRQPGTQRHARIRNTGGVTSTAKYFHAHQWRWVPFLVGVYLRQPGTQRHARIWNTGGVTTTYKYFQADQWRWVPFLCVPAPTRDLTSCYNLNTGPTKDVTTTDQFNGCHGPGQMIFLAVTVCFWFPNCHL
ncbi:hypothetical protein EMCRGX_G030151 [Ephydatia muelleri]